MKKKKAMAISFALGTLMFVSTAFAEINTKGGYEQLKDAMKYTSKACAEKLSSYTMQTSGVVKDNGKIIAQGDNVKKCDLTKVAEIEQSSDYSDGKSHNSEYYNDSEEQITFDKDTDSYSVYKYLKKREEPLYQDMFKNERADDAERIVDAAVGSLKDLIVVDEKDDGTKELSGRISDSQVPAVANALISFGLKQSYHDNNPQNNNNWFPKLETGIYAQEARGNARISKDGLIESLTVSATVVGKDDKGVEHKLTCELLFKISNVNNTVVNKPDFGGKKVVVDYERDYDKITNPKKYVGIYKNDIVVEREEKFEKIGERVVEITSFDGNNIAGRYHEEYKKGCAECPAKPLDIKFSTKFELQGDNKFEFTDYSGKKVNAYIEVRNNSNGIRFFWEGQDDSVIDYTTFIKVLD